MSARYVFTFEYMSERDYESYGVVAINWTGNGWLEFWKRCMDSVMDWRREHGMRDGRCHAYDNWFEVERSW